MKVPAKKPAKKRAPRAKPKAAVAARPAKTKRVRKPKAAPPWDGDKEAYLAKQAVLEKAKGAGPIKAPPGAMPVPGISVVAEKPGTRREMVAAKKPVPAARDLLNPKQLRFIQEYIVDLNATQAAQRAGYSAKTAYSQGERLLKNVEVAAAIARAIEERSLRTEVSSDWLLKRLAAEAQADVADLYDATGDLRPVKDWPLIWRQGLVAGIESVREKIGEDGDGEPVFAMVRKIKLSDRGKRLELIGRHVNVQAFRDRVDVEVKQDVATMLAERRRRAMTHDE